MKKKIFSMHVDLDDFIPATEEEKAYMVQMRPSTTFFKDGMKRLLKNKIATLSMIIIILITLISGIEKYLQPRKRPPADISIVILNTQRLIRLLNLAIIIPDYTFRIINKMIKREGIKNAR